MSLNIKNPKTYKLAQEVAQLTGESMAQAVTTALEERKAKLEKEDRIARLTAISKSIAKRLNAPGGPKMMEIEDLYDEETGLPK
jgi:antitoxin VapB